MLDWFGNTIQSDVQNLALGLFLFFVASVTIVFLVTSREHHFQSRYSPFRYNKRRALDLTNPARQLNAVMAASFEKRKVLNYSEFQVFRIIEQEVAAARRGCRAFAQTSLGEILHSTSEDAFHSINSKRVDILIVDKGGWPILAVEYQGNQHYQAKAAARDAVKKEALRKAGVRYIEVGSAESDDLIRARIREQLGWKNPTSTKSDDSFRCETLAES